MPLGIGLSIAGIAGAGGAIYGANKQAGAARTAGDIQGRAADEALAFEREQFDLEKKQYEEERARDWGFQDQDRMRAEEDRQRRIAHFAPYEAFGRQGVRTLGRLLNVPKSGLGDLHVRPSPTRPPGPVIAPPTTNGRSVADLAAMPSVQPAPFVPVPPGTPVPPPDRRTLAQLAAMGRR